MHSSMAGSMCTPRQSPAALAAACVSLFWHVAGAAGVDQLASVSDQMFGLGPAAGRKAFDCASLVT